MLLGCISTAKGCAAPRRAAPAQQEGGHGAVLLDCTSNNKGRAPPRTAAPARACAADSGSQEPVVTSPAESTTTGPPPHCSTATSTSIDHQPASTGNRPSTNCQYALTAGPPSASTDNRPSASRDNMIPSSPMRTRSRGRPCAAAAHFTSDNTVITATMHRGPAHVMAA